MIANLRECKAKLSALVELASRGEEIVITVHGKPSARLCPIASDDRSKRSEWGRSLKEARAKYTTRVRNSSSGILDDVRGDRL